MNTVATYFSHFCDIIIFLSWLLLPWLIPYLTLLPSIANINPLVTEAVVIALTLLLLHTFVRVDSFRKWLPYSTESVPICAYVSIMIKSALIVRAILTDDFATPYHVAITIAVLGVSDMVYMLVVVKPNTDPPESLKLFIQRRARVIRVFGAVISFTRQQHQPTDVPLTPVTPADASHNAEQGLCPPPYYDKGTY